MVYECCLCGLRTVTGSGTYRSEFRMCRQFREAFRAHPFPGVAASVLVVEWQAAKFARWDAAGCVWTRGRRRLSCRLHASGPPCRHALHVCTHARLEDAFPLRKSIKLVKACWQVALASNYQAGFLRMPWQMASFQGSRSASQCSQRKSMQC